MKDTELPTPGELSTDHLANSLDQQPELSRREIDVLLVTRSLQRNDIMPSGVNIRRMYWRMSNDELPTNQAYRIFDKLDSFGLLRKEDEDGRTNRYVLTDDGKEYIRDRYRILKFHVVPDL